MTVEAFIVILSILSVVSSLLTEAFKKLLGDSTVSYNVVVLINSSVVGLFGMVFYYIFYGIPFTLPNIICIPLMMISNWLVAMLGYDKVIQTIMQVKSKEV